VREASDIQDCENKSETDRADVNDGPRDQTIHYQLKQL
jgi:hypothetical protein